MITATQIESLRRVETNDYKETEQLKEKFAQLRIERQPFYLTSEEFDEILKWKLGQQFGRQRDMRANNSDELIRAVTGLALTITHSDKEYELELRVGILCSLRGIGVPVASAVLALIFPKEYAVIDFRGWGQIFDEKKTDFSIPEYNKYLHEIHRLAIELGWDAQEVDHAIWEYDKKQPQKKAVLKPDQ